MTLNNYLEFGSEEIVIRLKPKLTGRNAAWSGDVDISIDCFEDNPLSAKDFQELITFTQMVVASPLLIEQNPEFKAILYNLSQSYEKARGLPDKMFKRRSGKTNKKISKDNKKYADNVIKFKPKKRQKPIGHE